MPALRTAIIGFGLAGRHFHAPLVRSVDGLTLDVVVTSKPRETFPELPSSVRSVADVAAVLADPAIDLVVVATPNTTHAPIADAALRAGKHVVVDKPFAPTHAEAKALVELAQERGRQLVVFHNRRFDADFLTLRALRDGGQLGEIVEMRSSFDRYRPQVADRWRERPEPGAGLWFDLGPHLLDQALALFGAPKAMHADIAMQRDGAQVDDYFAVTLVYDRLRVHLHASSLASWSDERFVVHGTKASFVKHGVDPQEAALRAGNLPTTAAWGVDPRPGTLIDVRDGVAQRHVVDGVAGDYRKFYSGVRDAIALGSEPPVSSEDALQTMLLLEEARDIALRSSRSDAGGAG